MHLKSNIVFYINHIVVLVEDHHRLEVVAADQGDGEVVSSPEVFNVVEVLVDEEDIADIPN